MAYLTINFFSDSLRREVTFNALLPIDGPNKLDFASQQPLKSIYLLNGFTGSHNDWISYTRIRKLSDQYNIAVFMPAGENHFYVDHEAREEFYGQFVGEELVEFTRQCFPISTSREHTFIGGLSMGGYGAIRNGLKYSEQFGGVIALSAALIPYRIANASPDYIDHSMRQPYFESVFGDLTKLLGSDKDPEALMLQLIAAERPLPHIYLTCGTEDFLYDVNVRYHQFLLSNAIEHTYKEKPGDHTWEFWDEGIEDALNWISALSSTKD